MREVASVVYSLGRETSHTKWAEAVAGSESLHTRSRSVLILWDLPCPATACTEEHWADRKSWSGKCKNLNLKCEPESDFLLHLCSTRRASAGTNKLIFLLEQKAQSMVLVSKVKTRGPKWENKSCSSKRLCCELTSPARPRPGYPLCLRSPLLMAGLSLTSGLP